MKTWKDRNKDKQDRLMQSYLHGWGDISISTRDAQLLPTDYVEGFYIRPGFFQIKGAYQTVNGVSFTISSHGATGCTLLLFRPREAEPYARIRFPEGYKIGDTYSMLVYDLQIQDFEYAYQFEGPYQPEKGLLFNPENIILDPYAKAVTGQRKWGEKPEGQKAFTYRARVVRSTFDWGNVRQLETPLEDLVIYETHVRGFTKDPSSGVVAKGTYEGLREKIPYLKDLGINAVELLPVFEFDEIEKNRIFEGKQLYNYWGYNTVGFFAPNTGYTYEEEHNHEGDELKGLIRELHENGIEVILDVVFNHTAEGNEDGHCFSFKGIDNNIYYMLTPDYKYCNFSGTGNVLNCNHPAVRMFIIDCLHYWATEYRVDGFRFDLASILGRDQNGVPMSHPPTLETMAFDPVLSKTKLIAEAWDAGGLYQVGSFPSWDRWAEWNGRYRDDMRMFLKGDDDTAEKALTRIKGSQDLYSPSGLGHRASVNFLTCHDGFTLYDLYSYNTKHNEKNGWKNTDGDNNGHSWNCGAEGMTEDIQINNLRRRMVKNAFAALLCSRGAAMFLSGDEFCNTQYGNNNAYCQDNRISWLDWNRLTEFREVHDFARFMIRFRKDHPILRKSTAPCACGLEEISIHNDKPYNAKTEYNTHMIGVMFAGRNADDTGDDIIFYCMNSYWEPLVMQLPSLPDGKRWRVEVNTNCEYREGTDFGTMTEWLDGCRIRMPARTTIILVAE